MTAPVDVALRIRSFIDEELLTRRPIGPIDDEMQLLDGLLDSSGLMQLTTYLEEEFGVEINDSDVTRENFNCVADIATLVRSKLDDEPSPVIDPYDATLRGAEG